MSGIDYSGLDLMDALDLAILIEAEAQQRYELFAEQLGHSYDGDAGGIFEEMSVNEAKHAAELYQRRVDLFGDAPMRVSRDAIFDVEAPEVGANRWGISARKALEIALESEKKAMHFYSDAMKAVTNESIKELFLELRDEEVDHVRMVK